MSIEDEHWAFKLPDNLKPEDFTTDQFQDDTGACCFLGHINKCVSGDAIPEYPYNPLYIAITRVFDNELGDSIAYVNDTCRDNEHRAQVWNALVKKFRQKALKGEL